MPYIVVHMIQRTTKARRAVAKAVTDAVVESLQVPPEKVHVIIQEMEKDQNATAGVLYCDAAKKSAVKTRGRKARR